jgi:hypothetical protein
VAPNARLPKLAAATKSERTVLIFTNIDIEPALTVSGVGIARWFSVLFEPRRFYLTE